MDAQISKAGIDAAKNGFDAQVSRRQINLAPSPMPVASIQFIGRQPSCWSEIKSKLEDRSISVSNEYRSNGLSNREQFLKELGRTNCDVYVIGTESGPFESYEVCARLRQSGHRGQILVVSESKDAFSRILALERGADAWLPSDSDARTVVAQIVALMRRAPAVGTEAAAVRQRIFVGEISLDSGNRSVTIGRKSVQVRSVEFDILWLLATNAGLIVPHDQLNEYVRSRFDSRENQSIRTYVSRLRNRLGEPFASQIRTIHGNGYMLAHAPTVKEQN